MSVKWKHKLILKKGNTRSLCLVLAGAGLFRDKKGDFSVSKISLLVLGVFVLIGFIYFVSALEEIDSVILNSSLGANTTIENLTAYVDPFNSSQKYIYDWRKQNSTGVYESIALLNMPMEGDINERLKDYSSFNTNVVMGLPGTTDDPIYNATGGYDGKGAFEFTGGNERRLSVPDNTILAELEDSITITMWAKLDAYGANSALYANYKDDNERWHVYVNTTGTLKLYDIDGVEDSYFLDTNYTFSTNQWVHLAIIGDYNDWRIYANGNLVLNETCAVGNECASGLGNEGFVNISRDSYHYFGVRNGGGFGLEWDGTIDEVMVFNRSLGGEQISQIYNEQSNHLDSSTIVSGETVAGENWSVMATPVYEDEIGVSVLSNNLTILSAGCPSYPQNWNVAMSDYLWVNSLCNLTGYNITFSGAGNFTVNATIYVNQINNLSSNMTVWMKPDGVMWMGAN